MSKKEKAADAADALKLTADDLLRLNLIDQIIPEPLGGAHRDSENMADTLKTVLLERLLAFKKHSLENLISNRYQRLMAYG